MSFGTMDAFESMLFDMQRIKEQCKPAAAVEPSDEKYDEWSPLRWSLHFLPHHVTIKKFSQLHKDSAKLMAGMRDERNQRINILAPRGNAKSTLWTLAYPLQEALAGRERFIVIVSETSSLATGFLRTIRRELETNEAIREAYPEASGRGPIWNHDHIEMRNGVTIIAIGTGGKIRGRKEGSSRPTLIICDDLQSKDHITSHIKRAAAMEWLTKDLVSAGQPGTNIVVIGTAIHQECVVCVLQKAPGWQSLMYQAIQKYPDRMDLWGEWENILFDHENQNRLDDARAYYDANPAMRDGHKVLWEPREPLYDLMLLRASIGVAAFGSEKQNNPINPDTCEWPEVYFDRPDLYFDEWPADLQIRTLALDPSKGAQDRVSDYWAYVKYGRDKHGFEYVEADLQRGDVDKMVAAGVKHIRQFGPEAFGIETNSFQQLLVAPFTSAIRESRVECPIVEVENMVAKATRIRRLTTPLAERRLRFKRKSPGTELLLSQIRQWPQADHDDGPDCLEVARRIAVQLVNGEIKRDQFGRRQLRA